MVELSIERTIRRSLLILMLCLGLAVLLVSYFGLRQVSLGIIEQRIDHDIESLISALKQTEEGGESGDADWIVDQAHLPLVYDRVDSGHYYALRVGERVHYSRSVWDTTFEIKTLPIGATEQLQIVQASGAVWLVRGVGIERGGQAMTLWVAEDVQDVLLQQNYVVGAIATLLLLTIFLMLVVQGRVIRYGFAKLDPVRESIQAGESANLIEPSRVPTEVAPLLKAIEGLIKRSTVQVERTRTSLGNLAHELKRPIQRLKWIAKDAQEASVKDELELLASELSHITQRELKRARIAGNPTPGRNFNPTEDLATFTEIFERIYQKPIHFKSRYPKGALPFDRDDILELLGNLLDNAWRFAATEVQLHISPIEGGNAFEFCVEDDGPGVVQEQLELLSVRGLRLDELQQTETGSGLGISICQSIAASYQGRLEFSRSALGGLKVRATLGFSDQ